ncbi:polysaccharide pyruvyl transferase family protein [Streptomyces sp. NPDC004082]|uniref:polysaccharide pyruvyl transferase family protein n=1 Tax=Streptomyces sp. NPDC005481 TaxID=3154881 RepID=UPI0033A3B95E
MSEIMERRTFLGAAAGAGLAAALQAALPTSAQAAGRAPRILLRSSWQTVNIGDVAHTPGILALLEKHLPQAEVQLWPSSVGNGVKEMLTARFPRLRVIDRSPAGVRAALEHNDFLLHGSGPMLLGIEEVDRWQRETGKPYGVYGITQGTPDTRTLPLLNGASFVYLRDSVSLAAVRAAGVSAPIVEFGPDAAFATDLRDDAAADAYLRDHGLAEGKFLCVLGRLRKTPYWEIYGREMTEQDKIDHAYNEKMKEHDHAPLRKAITEVVRNTDMKVLLCPEDESQVKVNRENLYDPLPADVKERVVLRRTFWLPSEAVSTYARSAGLVSNEMHSPILAIGHDVPAIVCRWKEQTSKGFMWADIGLGDWLFDMDDSDDLHRIAPAALWIAGNPARAKAQARKARKYAANLHRQSMADLKQRLDSTRRSAS